MEIKNFMIIKMGKLKSLALIKAGGKTKLYK
jgi:hypothetical protein